MPAAKTPATRTRLRPMDAPPIHYARTEDEVSLAYWTLGERTNPALILVPWGIGHLTVEWDVDGVGEWYTRLAQRFFLLAFDARGNGLSSRDATDLSLGRYAEDIGVVAATGGVARYALYGGGPGSAPPSIAHAVACPESVTHLVFHAPIARGRYFQNEEVPLTRITDANWDFIRPMMGPALAGPENPGSAAQWTAVFAAATTGNHYQQWSDEIAEWDVMALLPGIQANTLVFSAPGIRYAPHAAAQEIAEGIPNARPDHRRGPVALVAEPRIVRANDRGVRSRRGR